MILSRICVTIGFCAAIAFVFVAHAYWFVPNHDSATYVVEAQKLLAGGRFYDDIMETNPPLIVLLTAPGILISQAAGLDPWTGFTAWVCFLMIISLLVAYPYLRWGYSDQPGVNNLLAVVYLVVIALFPSYSFAQREHLTVVLFLPSLLWFAAREGGRPSPPDLRCFFALVLAALGLLIKPFFLVVPAILVIVRAATHRNWKMLIGIETVVVLLVSLLYAVAVYAFFREYLSTATLAAQVYFGFELSWPSSLFSFWRESIMLVAVVVIFYVTPMELHRRIFLRQLVIAAAVFLAVAILQRKGWSYQALPMRELTILLVALMGLELFGRFQRNRTLDKAAQASCLALLCVGCSFMGFVLLYHLDSRNLTSTFLAEPFPSTVRQLAYGKPWLALSTSVGPAFPTILLSGGQWSSRSPHQWMIPGILKLNTGDAEDRARAEKLKLLATRFVIEDLERYRPLMVAVKAGGDQAIEGAFEFLPFFGEDESFRRAWKPYRLEKSIEGWQFYVRTSMALPIAGSSEKANR